MKLDDIFFAIGIIAISSLLVFVIYDDLTSNPYQEYIDEINEISANEKLNISENDTRLLPTALGNNTVNIETVQKTKTTYSQSSDTTTLTQKLDTRSNSNYNSVQSSKQLNDVNNEIKNYAEDSKKSDVSDRYNKNLNRPNNPSKKEK